jgi:uncharacterized metal-binding protein
VTDSTRISCAECDIAREQRICTREDGLSPDFCPTTAHAQAIDQAKAAFDDPSTLEFARLASVQEGAGYAGRDAGTPRAHKPRIQEVCEFAGRMGFKKLGLAFCVGLEREARILNEILEVQGFDVVSVMCKVGRVPKETIGITDSEKIVPGGPETMCNSIGQAEIMNAEKTELNLVLGLCVGHDSLFMKHSDAYCTVVAVKDRVTGHNPLAALYTSHSYYARLLRKGF